MAKSSTKGETAENGRDEVASVSSETPLVDRAFERRAVRKLDLTILPVMTMFYLLSFLDRANIGNARVAGLQKALHLTDHQYQVCVTVLYVPYICAELPANLLLRKIGPNILMPTLLTIWGIIVTLQGLVTSYAGLIVVRALLGLIEGPMFPGITLYLSGFYTRKELAVRIAIFFSAASLSGAFSGLLAAGISQMDGIGGKAGWSWIFILEGLFSILMGILGFFLTPSTPRDSRFLTDAQKDVIMARLERDRPTINPLDHFSIKEVFRALASPHVLILFIMFFMSGTMLYGLALFLPSIVNQLGFSPNRSQLYSVGPFAAGFFVTMISAYFSDRARYRALPIVLISCLAITGFSVYLRATSKWMAYGSLFLTVPGVYAPVPIISAWMANNSEPHYRRASAIAIGFIATNSGGILSTWRFPSREGPRFIRTTIMDLVFACVVVVGAILNCLILAWKNKQKQKNRDKLLAPYSDEKQPDGGPAAWSELGDRHPDFVYAI